MRCCAGDEGLALRRRPAGVDVKPPLRWLKTVVVSVGEKAQSRVRWGPGWTIRQRGVTTGVRADSLAGWWQSVADAAARFDDALDAAGRPAEDVRRFLSLDASGTFALTSADYFADAVGRAAELGFTDVITHWPRPSGWYAGDESVLESVAARISSGHAG